jgi:hypothetical protein
MLFPVLGLNGMLVPGPPARPSLLIRKRNYLVAVPESACARNSSSSLAMIAILRASSFVSNLAADRRPGTRRHRNRRKRAFVRRDRPRQSRRLIPRLTRAAEGGVSGCIAPRCRAFQLALKVRVLRMGFTSRYRARHYL